MSKFNALKTASLFVAAVLLTGALNVPPSHAQEPLRLTEIAGNNQVGILGELLKSLIVKVIDEKTGAGVPGVPVTFSRVVGDGTLEDPSGENGSPTEQTVTTDAEGIAKVDYRLGQEPLHVVSAQAPDIPNQIVFRATLGPLAGNGQRPVNIAVSGGRGYTANRGTSNVSVFDATDPSRAVEATLDLTFLKTTHDAGQVRGVTVDPGAGRLYIYATVVDSEGHHIVLLEADTATNALVEPIDIDGDGIHGLTLFTNPGPTVTGSTVLPPGRALGIFYGNLLTADGAAQRVYAVVPGVIELRNDNRNPVRIENGRLMVIDVSSSPVIQADIPIGEVPTGVAVNVQTNRIYVTNRGYYYNDDHNDSLTVIDGGSLTVIDEVTVGRSPMGMRVDEAHDVIYVANRFGAETLQSSGAITIIDGKTNTVAQTLATVSPIDLALLTDDNTNRIYLNGGTIIDCDAITLTESCSILPERSDLRAEKLALNDSKTLLFGTSMYDNHVTAVDLSSNRIAAEIQVGVKLSGLAVNTQNSTTYVSNVSGDELLAVDASGNFKHIELGDLGLFNPRYVALDETQGRIYVLSWNSSSPPLMVLDSTSHEPVANLARDEWGFGRPVALAIDEARNVLYVITASDELLMVDGAKLVGTIAVNTALLEDAFVDRSDVDRSEFFGGVAVDAERNLIYVTRNDGLFVLQGPELDAATRALQRSPQIVAQISGIGSGAASQIALDKAQNLIYVAGAYGSISSGEGFGPTDISVLDGLRIVSADGQVSAAPEQAVLGKIPIKMARTASGEPLLPIVGDYYSSDLAFNANEGLLYVVSHSNAFFTEGFVSVIDGNSVIDAERNLITTPHPSLQGTYVSLSATLPAGIDPEFIAVDAARNRVVVSNQSPGVLLVLEGL